MGTISENFSYREFERTDFVRFQTQNVITDSRVRDAVKALVLDVLQPLRDAWGKPLTVNSGYRCPALNAYVGGVPASQHLKGEAADIAAEDPHALAGLAKSLGLPYDQMILYPSFVHFSHRLDGTQRGMVLYNKSYMGERLK